MLHSCWYTRDLFAFVEVIPELRSIGGLDFEMNVQYKIKGIFRGPPIMGTPLW